MVEFMLFGNTLVNYFWFILFIVIGFVVGSIVVYFSKHVLHKLTKYTKTKVDDIISNILSKPLPLKIVIITIFFNIGFNYLIVSVWWTKFIKEVSFLVYVFAITLFIIKFCIGLIEEYLEVYAQKTDSKYDDQLIPLLKSLIKIVFFVLAILLIISNFGYNISALLAGLGIGGLAVAMASKDIVENFLAGIVIFVEKPFKITDILKTSDGVGIVEEIGIRSTKIRTFDNTLVVIPNRNVSSNSVENISARRARKQNFSIGLVYLTSVKKMEDAKKIIINIFKSNKHIEQDSFVVSFESFGDYSLNIRVMYWISEMDYFKYLKVRDHVNMTIKKEFEKAKIEMAFPTQTVEISK
jgi:MscS family membrane protein